MSSFAKISIRFNADLKQFSSQMQNAQKRLDKVGKQMQNAGRNLTLGLTAPIVALGYKSVKTFADFEQALAKVEAVSGATSEQMKALRKNAEDLGATTRFTASNVAQLQLNLSKLGFNSSEILKSTDGILALAQATGEDLAQSATVAASTLRGFQLDASETGKLVDVMADSFSSSALDLMKFETAMSVLAPVANSAGYSIQQTTGMMAVLANAGVDASTVGTGLRNVFLDLAKKGLSLDEAMKIIQTSTNKNATAMDLFGKRGATVGTVLAANYEQAKEFAVQFDNAGGAAKRMATIMDNTLEGAFFRLNSAMESFYIAIGEELAPVLGKMADAAAVLVAKFKDLDGSTKKIIIAIGVFAAALGPILLVVGTLATSALPALAAGFAALTGPIGLVIAAIAGIAYVVYKNWDRIKKEFVSLQNYFIDLYNESVVVRVGIENIVLQFKTLFNVAKLVIDVIVTGFKNGAKLILESFKNIGDGIKAVLTGDVSALPGIFKRQADLAGKNFKDLFKGIGDDIKNFTDNMSSDFQDSIDRIQKKKKLEFKADVVIEDVKTSGTDAAGATPGGEGGEGGRGIIKSATALTTAMAPIQQGPLDLIAEKMPKQAAIISDEQLKMMESAMLFNEGLTEIINNTARNFAVGFGEMIGSAMAGNFGISSITNLIMDTMGNMAIQIGQMAIGIGLAVEGIKTALQSLSGPVAIAAGIALVALGSFVKSALSSQASNPGTKIPALADGGIASGPTLAYVGEYAGASSNPEVIAPLDKLKNLISDTVGGGQLQGEVRLIVHGKDLKGALDHTNAYLGRRR